MRNTMIGLSATLALALAPAIASANSISEVGGAITIQAAPGETNNINEQLVATNLRFTDNGTKLDGNPIAVTPSGTCAVVTANSVDCPAATATSLQATLLDQSDTMSLGAMPATVPATIDGGDGNDDIAGTPGNDVLRGGGGSDSINGRQGNDNIDGGGGDDTLIGEDNNTPGGNDTLTGDGGDDTLRGGPGNDSLDGGDGEDRVFTDPGNDTISGGDGTSDSYDASNDDENVNISLDGVANDTSSSGTDNVMPDIEDVSTGAGDDVVTGDAANNDISTQDGNDVVDGGAGNDYISLGSGNDIGSGNVGNDAVFGSDGNDIVDGGPDQDVVEGNRGTDIITGGTGNDNLEPDTGSDTISGGAGIDEVQYGFESELGESNAGGVAISLDGVANDGQPGENQNVATDVENVDGSEGNDVIVGNPTIANVLQGDAGNDVITSADTSADLVQCGTGFDTVVADALDTIDHNVSLCESIAPINFAGFGPTVGVVLASKAKKTEKLTASCPFNAVGFCSTTVSLKAGGKSAGSVAFYLLPGQSAGQTITLSSSAAKSLKKSKKLKVTVTIAAKDGRNATKSSTQTKTLKY